MKSDKNALARAQRQFYNEYEQALIDPNKGLPTAQEVSSMFLRAQNVVFRGEE